ncbi:MAG: translation elongation factor 4 [Minisyncoccia bacterium]
MLISNIRNFCIIAHIDHGKSTLADRFLEKTHTVDTRKMHNQYLDQLELERERGITIKMTPVKMHYQFNNENYILNLIDTPGHSDFSYEVSRSLSAVEGAILLIDVTQGIQAQTLSNFEAAKDAGLKIIGVINKIDVFQNLNDPKIQQLKEELKKLIKSDDILLVSGKTGYGVDELLQAIILKIPSPAVTSNYRWSRALIFDSFYDEHKGIIASVRVVNGNFKPNDNIYLAGVDCFSKIKEVGYFLPNLKSGNELSSGEIGYIVTGLKDPGSIKIGDTMIDILHNNAINIDEMKKIVLPGYKEPQPVIFVSFYPNENDKYEFLAKALQKLHLNDSSLFIEPDKKEILGRGFRVGFLGKLHFEITAERLEREFKISTINTFPSVVYKIKDKNGNFQSIDNPDDLPNEYLEIWEPYININIFVPVQFLSNVLMLQKKFRLTINKTENINDRINISGEMPLTELISNFDDQLKSLTQGFASFSYVLSGYKKSDVIKIDVYVTGEKINGLSKFVPKVDLNNEARKLALKLKQILPKQQFSQSIQIKVGTKVIAREDIPAMRKDVTGYLYGGDRTRKMKLWQKQKRGKAKLKAMAKIKIPFSVFKELLNK